MSLARRLSALLGLGLLLASGPAAAYVRTINSANVPVRWMNTCISLVAHTDNVPAPFDADSMLKAVEAAGKIWGRPSYTCTPLTLTTTEEKTKPGVVARDGANRVMFVTDRWCRKTGTDDRLCYPRSTLAITTVMADSAGRIIEADIEINAINFTWDDRMARPKSGGQDLQTAVVHELGHLVGLDHNCAYPGSTYSRINNEGDPVPECSTASYTMRSTVMYPSANDNGELKRRLSGDETQFLCEVYPAATNNVPPVCGPVLANTTTGTVEETVSEDHVGGCSVSGASGGSSGMSGLLLLGLAYLSLGLRRRR